MDKKNRKHRRVTQHDIAAAAGCSQNTVALALRGSQRISPERRKTVEEVARSLGYRPNLAARSLRRGRSGLVGVFTGPLDDARIYFATQVLNHFHCGVAKPVIGSDPQGIKPWYTAPWIETFLDLQVEAIVCFAWHDTPQLPPWADQVPIIMSGNQPDDHLPCDSISMDRRTGVRLGVEHLINRGHKRIALVMPNRAHLIEAGYQEGMENARLQPNILAKHVNETSQQFLQRIVDAVKSRAKDSPTAVLVLNSTTAAELNRLALSNGLRIPNGLAVVGYGCLNLADRLYPALTTVEQPIEELVATTSVVTNNRLENLTAEPVHITLPFRLRVRESS